MSIFDSFTTKRGGDAVNLYYTDRKNEYQYGTDLSRMEMIWREQDNKHELVMRPLPEDRRFVQNDIAPLDNSEMLLKTMLEYAKKYSGDTKVVLEGPESTAVCPKNWAIVKSWVVVDKDTDGEAVSKVYALEADSGEVAMFRVIASNNCLCFAEMDFDDYTVDLQVEEDEMKVEIPTCMAISKNEITLMRFLNEISCGKYHKVSMIGCLYK